MSCNVCAFILMVGVDLSSFFLTSKHGQHARQAEQAMPENVNQKEQGMAYTGDRS
jgi:hypothetical protein